MPRVFDTASQAALCLLVAAPVTAWAQTSEPTEAAPRKAHASAGASLQEFVKRQRTRLLGNDTDGDGKISQAEFVAAARTGKGDPGRRFARIDRNSDGRLDIEEVDAMLTRRFQRLDSNGDGIASADERATVRANLKSGMGGSGS